MLLQLGKKKVCILVIGIMLLSQAQKNQIFPFFFFVIFGYFFYIQAKAAATTDENHELPTAKDVSVAYCSIAEIYLTDLWYNS